MEASLSEIKIRKVQVTPDLAKRWLKTNQDNRKVSEAWVRKLARDMVNDDFPNLAETIKFDTERHLIDGQHRLEAVKLSGKTIEFFVAEGIPREHRYRMDKNRPRKVSDQLTMQHRIPSAQMAVAAVRIILMWQIEVIKSETFKPTDSEIIDFTVKNQELINQAVRYGMSLRSEIGALPSPTAAIYFLTYEIDAAEALQFWDLLKSGEGLHKGDPELTLRAAIGRLQVKGGEKNPKSFMAMVAKAWNARREGKKMLALAPKPSADLTDENFRLA
jgi:hypothetical protein